MTAEFYNPTCFLGKGNVGKYLNRKQDITTLLFNFTTLTMLGGVKV